MKDLNIKHLKLINGEEIIEDFSLDQYLGKKYDQERPASIFYVFYSLLIVPTEILKNH